MMRFLFRRVGLALIMLGFALGASGAEQRDAQSAVHMLNRIAYGPRPGDVERVARMGVDRYVDEQLHPDTLPIPADLEQTLASLPTRHMTTGELISKFRGVAKAADPEEAKRERRDLVRQVASDNNVARLTRAIESPRQ